MLHSLGIEVVVLERRNRAYVEGRVRAGVLEQITVDLMHRLGVGERLAAEGLIHGGTNLAYDGGLFRIDLRDLTGGSAVTVYGQQEVMKDLFEAAAQRGVRIVFDTQDLDLHDLTSGQPSVTWRQGADADQLDCDFLVGCDGFRGVSRGKIPAVVSRTFERVYPFSWLGILAETTPVAHELIYCNHEHGFALASMRSSTRSRYYIQCAQNDNIDDWPDERFWDELCLRLSVTGAVVTRGPSFEKSIAPLRSFVTEPMQHGRLFLAGDSAHIVPPTGAKGMNLAVSDVIVLAEAFEAFYLKGSEVGLDGYSARALDRVWKAERFSWWFTGLTHRFPETDAFGHRMQLAEIEYISRSRAAQTVLAENYVGLPIAGDAGSRWRA